MPDASNYYVGFGFGAIQAGLFLYEAYHIDPNRNLIVAEVIPEVVSAVKQAGGAFHVNIAFQDRIEVARVENLDIKNPTIQKDRNYLIEAIACASEIGTALPSVEFYHLNGNKSVSGIIAEGLIKKFYSNGPPVIVYTAENNNLAAEILEEKVMGFIPGKMHKDVSKKVQFLNTVIGKMSQVILEKELISTQKMIPITPHLNRAFLVESFNRIQISKIHQPDIFKRGIPVFEEKEDLLRFEEAKLYGHNATHALIGYLSAMVGADDLSKIPENTGILSFAKDAFLQESGKALIHKYQGSDVLFTEKGFYAYVDDLMRRMTNPFLRDKVERVTRDTHRKLTWNDRLIGTIRMALQCGIHPERFLIGALAALYYLDDKVLDDPGRIAKILDPIWDDNRGVNKEERETIISFLMDATIPLKKWVNDGFGNLNACIK